MAFQNGNVKTAPTMESKPPYLNITAKITATKIGSGNNLNAFKLILKVSKILLLLKNINGAVNNVMNTQTIPKNIVDKA